MTEAELRHVILDALVTIEKLDGTEAQTARDDARKDIIFGDLGIDSVTVMDFCVLIEDRIGRDLEVVEIVDNPSVNKLARHLAVA
jgi:acyl carrier protein